jgi:hypothetical protein
MKKISHNASRLFVSRDWQFLKLLISSQAAEYKLLIEMEFIVKGFYISKIKRQEINGPKLLSFLKDRL